ncbi:helix-turn-helix domain-containing protein [Haloactinopolyspora alba]|uniref:helix-turn-helix domain-containing protein n=1 Tax=Haloactinopolyspora alba TaxID=648780 RepID=UPI000D0D9897
MDELEELLGVNSESPAQRLASILVREDVDLLSELRDRRKASGLTQAEVAERLGVTQETVSAFERLGNDPRLSTVRRYAAAIGVVVRHETETFEPSRDSVRHAFGTSRSRRAAIQDFAGLAGWAKRHDSVKEWKVHAGQADR